MHRRAASGLGGRRSSGWACAVVLIVMVVLAGSCGEAAEEPFTFTEACSKAGSQPGFDMYQCREASDDPRFSGYTRMWYSTRGVVFELSNDGGTWLGTGHPIGDGTWTGIGYGTGGYEGLKYRYEDGPPTFTVTIARGSPADLPSFATSETGCTSSSEADYRYECVNTAADVRFEGTKFLSGNSRWSEGTFKVVNDRGTWFGKWIDNDGIIEAIGVGTSEYQGLSVRFEGRVPNFSATIQSID